MERLALLGALVAAIVATATIWGRKYANRVAARALLRHRARVDRFKLASRAHVRGELMADPAIRAAAREHAAERGIPESAAIRAVQGYVDEIVPFFNVIAYFHLGLRVSRAVLNLLYNVTVE
ncbi:MAG TPA: hypothetical protein VF483_10285, partial [Gemmatimonadaceae bacterium]